MSAECPWAPPGQAELLARVQATDVDGLESAARGLRRTAGEYDRVAGEMNGVRAAACNYWQAGSQKSFDGYATVLTGNLTDAAAAMRAMADVLAAHARATDDAQRSVLAASGLANAGRYDPNQTSNDNQEQRLALQATHDFHASEQAARTKLWKLGADAPGGIPLPTRPPEPKLNWWQNLLSQSPYGPQFWINGKNMPLLGNPRAYDPKHPLYGFDEDGNKVPAYEADPMALIEKQDGLPIGPLVRYIRGIAEGEFDTVEEAELALARTVRSSSAFNPSHINQHIRDYYKLPGKGLAKDIPESKKPPVPEWAKQAFARSIAKASLSSKRVFEFRTGNDMSNAVLYTDLETHQPLIVMFHLNGEFCTAFSPNISKLDAVLRAKTVARQ